VTLYEQSGKRLPQRAERRELAFEGEMRLTLGPRRAA
jgi:hypothetical protein